MSMIKRESNRPSSACTLMPHFLNPSEPLMNDEILSLIHTVCHLEGYSTDYEWLVTFGRQRLIYLLLDKGCRATKHGAKNPALRSCIDALPWSHTIEELATLGAKITDVNCHGDTTLHLAYTKVKVRDQYFYWMLEHYLDNATENMQNNDGLSLLHIACAEASPDRVAQLLEQFPSDINQQIALDRELQYSGYTPLHLAVQFGRYEIVDLLLRNNADFNVRSSMEMTPVHLALYISTRSDKTVMFEIIDLLLSYDKDHENCVDRFGLSHLMVASAAHNANAIEKIVGTESRRNLDLPTLIKFRPMDTITNPFGGFSTQNFIKYRYSSLATELEKLNDPDMCTCSFLNPNEQS
ncbi:serine/threonine-protein phosphatase 6 regulatory ankyrin repeat subunit C-like [Phymastichus coffea]|uniref:serine/threonine-protein phosphatase 6 regulatory ankyrin repeat subunit C-like n=1 Tax=Phymastichus coffea TaxID=108790 RepID=UPI00273BCC24|nr:serine/threonine-protein phosphatase 6 regulatory ankyrin repeat subunit C-like [Phymastichus coffea]